MPDQTTPPPQWLYTSLLLDLVKQYGGALSRSYGLPSAASMALLARIAALVPQQPVPAGDLSGGLWWLHQCGEPEAVLGGAPDPEVECRLCKEPGPWRPLLVAAPDGDREHYDDSTLFKVHEALGRADIDGAQARDAVTEMQNAGILFRERHPATAPDGDRTPEVLPTDAELDFQIGEVTRERDEARAALASAQKALIRLEVQRDEARAELGLASAELYGTQDALIKTRADREELDDRAATALADVELLKLQVNAEIAQADEIAAWTDRLAWAALKHTGVRETEEASGNEELWQLALRALTTQVLRLPVPPEGTVALVGAVRYEHSGDDPFTGWRHPSGVVVTLGEVFDNERADGDGTVRVELAPPREPRTAAGIWATGGNSGAQDRIRRDYPILAEALDREVAADTDKQGAEDA